MKIPKLQKVPTMTWGKAQTILHDNYTGSPYQNILGTADKFAWKEWERQIEGLKGKRFGEYRGSGAEQIVYQDTGTPNQVLKIQSDMAFSDPLRAKTSQLMNNRLALRNQIPYQLQSKLEGFIKIGNKYFPVHKQRMITPLTDMSDVMFTKSIRPRIHESLTQKGFNLNQDGKYTNGKVILEDIKPSNIGFDDKMNLRFFDVQSFQI